MVTEKQRTGLQNSSLHLYFKLLAYELNDKSFDVMKTLRHDIAVPWNDKLIKELVWRKVQKTMTDKTSTARLNTSEVSQIYDVINRHIINITDGNVIVPFPEKFR